MPSSDAASCTKCADNCDVDCLYNIFLVDVSSCCWKAVFTQSHMELLGCSESALLQCVQHDKSLALLQRGLSPVPLDDHDKLQNQDFIERLDVSSN